jgi:hypothetical protein
VHAISIPTNVDVASNRRFFEKEPAGFVTVLPEIIIFLFDLNLIAIGIIDGKLDR